jgi:hypothetical protein
MVKLLITLVLATVGAGISAIDMVIRKQAGQPKATLWIAPVIAWGVLFVGWVFIFWQNNFHITTPVVMVSLAYLAVVATVYNLFRTGAAAVAPNDEDDGDASWGRPIGARGELEREKKTLLKAIKEAEFDQQMGKLSKADAEQMIRTIRARAIEVIKEIERLDAGAEGSVRDRIEREVKARLEISAVIDRKAAAVEKKKEDKAAKSKKGKAETKQADKPPPTMDEVVAVADELLAKAAKAEKADDKDAETRTEKADAKAEKVDDKSDAKDEKADAKSDDTDANAETKAEDKSDAKAEKAGATNGDANHADAKTEGDAMPDPVAKTSDTREARS